MASVFSYIPGVGGINVGSLVNVLIWTVAVVGVCGICFFLFFFALWKKKCKKVIEVNMLTKRIKFCSSREKKNANGVFQLWTGKLKKFLPQPQQKDLYLKGRQDVLFLLKDVNGMHHTLRVPTYKEIKKFHDVVYKKDIGEKGAHWSMFFLPNPYEDLDWLAKQCVEADKEYKDNAWWKHPNAMMVGMGVVCMIMFIMTIILTRKL